MQQDPFLFRYAEELPEEKTRHLLRYDAVRQISQALVNGEWIDTPDVRGELERGTRVTKAPAETTDDQ